MKLLRIHVDNFGKLNDLTLEFQDGINVIKEPNAWGKSTIAAFIKVMLFGFDSKKAPGATERERSFYMPWQGGVYGGELDFSVGSRSYRISRTFGASEKKDECHVYDLATNLESVDFGENIGEQLFDLDANSFKRSVFIAQNDCESTTSDAINAKLGNLAANTNDINNYETAQEALKAIANSLNPNRATGSIKKRRNRITELEEEIKGFESAAASLEEISTKKKEAEKNKADLTAQRENYANELKLASEDSRRCEKQKQYLELCKDAVAKLEALEAFSATFPVGAPDEESFNEAVFEARAYEEKLHRLDHLALTDNEKEQYEKLSAMFINAIPTDVEIDTMITRFSGVGEMKENKARIVSDLEHKEQSYAIVEPLPDKPGSGKGLVVATVIFEIIGLILFVLAILAFVLKGYAPYFMFIGVGVMLLSTLALIIGTANVKKAQNRYNILLEEFKRRQQEQIDEITGIKNQAQGQDSKIREVEEEIKAFLEKFSVFCGVASYSGALYELKSQAKDYHRLHARVLEMDQITFESRDEKSRIESFIANWQLNVGEDLSSSLIYLQTEGAKLRAAQTEALNATQKREYFEKNNDMEDLEQTVTATGSLEDINAQIAALDGELETVRAGIEQYSRQMEDLKEQLDLMDERKAELEENLETQALEQHRYAIVSRTQDYLLTAREQFTARYMAPISGAFRKYYNQIITSQGDDWVIDANIALKKREVGELRSVSHLSAGYQDLIGVCMRLALVDAMYQEEKPFLVLDDPFVNLDEEKTQKGMGLLNFVAADYQTIYFTCHTSRTP